MLNFFVYLAVIVCGAAVLAIEILGTRIIAPFYGASLYLWSALISVTLAALSFGYAVGGRMADKGPQLKRFCIIIGLAGIWIAIIPWLKVPLLDVSESVGLRAAVLITATVLFFPPLALLGMVSPYAIKLKTESLAVVGRTAGNLYAVSTVASVFAALLTGFLLIPNFGVYRLTFVIGLALIATAAAGLVLKRNKAILGTPVLLLVVAAGGLQIAPRPKAEPGSNVLTIRQSAYAEIAVVDLDDARYMLINGSTHTISDTAIWLSYFPYVSVMDIPAMFYDQPGDMLLIGLGGGSVARSYYLKDWKVDAVEIDPVVTELAHQFFHLRDKEATVYNMDGRKYLITHDKNYDIMILDAYGSSTIPFHLATEESFALMKSRLQADGILAINVEAVGWDDIIVKSLAATGQRVFKNVVVLPIAEPPNTLGNLVILGSDRDLTLPFELPVPYDRFSREYDQTHAWDNRFVVDTSGVQILTDNLNPVDLWSEHVNLVSRRQLHKFFDTEGIGW